MPLPTPLRLAIACVAACCLAFAALAQDAAPAAEKAKADRPRSDQPRSDQPRSDQPRSDPPAANSSTPSAADFEAFMKANQPGEHHAHLKPFVGTFDVEMEVVAAPGAPPDKSKGRQTAQMILDGRYLQSTYSGDMMGMKFTGLSLMGYDLQKKKYFNAWADSMSTALLVFEGSCDPAGKVFTFTGEYDDPMTKRKSKVRHVTTVVTPDKHTFEWFEVGEGGKEHRMMLATYTRTK